MPIDQFRIEDVPIYETEYQYPYHLTIESDGIWRVGSGKTIEDAIENFVDVRHVFEEPPHWVNE